MLSFLQENIKGILGTIAIHLIIYVVLMGLKIKQFDDYREDAIMLDFSESLTEVKKIEVNVEDVLPDMPDKWQKNIAQNVAKEFNEEISTEDYERELMEELGMTKEDFELPDTHDELGISQEKAQKKLEQKISEDPKVFNPKLETNTKFEIDRDVLNAEYPQYKCKGNGRVLMEIFVNQKGEVIQVKVLEVSSAEACVEQEAILAAYSAKFNADFSAPVKQRGTLMYRFVAQ